MWRDLEDLTSLWWEPCPVKGTWHYRLLLKIIVSNGELLIEWNIVRNGSLWSNLFFEKKSNFSLKYLDWIWDLSWGHEWEQSWGLEIKHLKLVRHRCFFFHYSLTALTTNWVQILRICWDTPSEKTSLWQLTKVSSAFKRTSTVHVITFHYTLLPLLYPSHAKHTV